MDAIKIYRDARVEGPAGDEGRVRHVIVDPETRELTHIVVEGGGEQWLTPISAVERVDDRHLRLLGRSLHAVSTPFRRDTYHAVDDQTVTDETTGDARHGGAPVRDAGSDNISLGAVETAASQRTTDRERAPELDAGGYRLELREERLRVEKEQIPGGVTVSKRVLERVETVEVPLREERVVIERRTGGGEVVIDGRSLAEGESVEIVVYREEARVEKVVVVSEDVSVRKESLERTEQVTETLRREELEVEDSGHFLAGSGDTTDAVSAADATARRAAAQPDR